MPYEFLRKILKFVIPPNMILRTNLRRHGITTTTTGYGKGIRFLLSKHLRYNLAFLRSLVVVGTAYSLAGWLFIQNACCISLLVAFTIICLILLIKIQVKIYYYYYEFDFYIKDNQSNVSESE